MVCELVEIGMDTEPHTQNKMVLLTSATTALASSAEQQKGLSPVETHVFLLHGKEKKMVIHYQEA